MTEGSASTRNALERDLDVAMRGGYVAELPTATIAERLIDAGWTLAASPGSASPEPRIRVCFDGTHAEGCSHANWASPERPIGARFSESGATVFHFAGGTPCRPRT